MKKLIIFYIGFLCICLSAIAKQTLERPRGEHFFTYSQYPPFADRPVDVHYYIPSQGDIKQMPIVFVFEGGDRGYRYLLDGWKEEAERKGFMLFIPHFDLKSYPLADYQEVGVMNAAHTVANAPEKITPVLVDKLFEYVRQFTGSMRKGYMIYGHSAGGQFVQRFMLFHDSPYVEKAIISSPGWYTFPDLAQTYPYGTAGIPYISSEQIKKYLSKPIILQLALGDTIRESFLRKTPEAERQGRNRMERGRSFWLYIHQLAASRGWECHWRKIEECGIGHEAVPMGKQAVPLLTTDSLRVLFIGNSYTFFNRLPWQVQSLASSCGKKISVRQVANPGWYLRQHAANTQTLEAIREGGWDYMVMQEQSKAPTREKEWVKKNVFHPAAQLDSLLRLYAPKGKSVCYMTWGRNNDTYEGMQQQLTENYLEMADVLDAYCAPVGEAWRRVRRECPSLQLYNSDGSHPSPAGSYLAACVFYAIFFGEPFSSDYYAGLPSETALYLQRIAQEVVLANLVLWNRNQSKQPAGVTASFYPDPKFDRETPTLSKPYGSGLASVDEIKDYLQQLVVRSPGLAYMENIGVTKQGRTIPVLYLGTPDKKKVRVWIQAALHGNEPAGAEAVCMLVRYLLCEKEGRELLNHIAVALVPIANVDGYAIQQRRSADGYDLNRDQSKLEDTVTLLLKQSYQLWNPDVALDIHEYTPLRREFNLLRGVPTANAADVLFLPTGHLNAPLALRTLSEELFRREAEVVLNSAGYASGFYFTPRVADGSLVLVKGAKSPQSSSTFQALTGAVSLFVEIRGIGLGPECFARRSECGFLVARQTLVTAAQHRASIKRKIEQARKRTLKATEPIYVTFTSDTVRHVVSFIDYKANELFKTELPTLDAMQATPQLMRTRPKAYLLDAPCTEAVCKLRALGVHIEQVTRVQKAKVERYKVTRLYRAEKEWEGIHPVNVETDVYEDNVELPIGSWLVPLAQPLGNLVATLLEPESVCGFVNFCVIPAEEGKGLFISRLIK